MRVFRFQQLAINCTFAKREKCKQHYRILREVDINITITKNDNINDVILKRESKDTES